MFLISPFAISSPMRASCVLRPRIPGDFVRAHQRRVAVGLVGRQFVAARVVELQVLGDAVVVGGAALAGDLPRTYPADAPCGRARWPAPRSRAPTPRPSARIRRTAADCCRSARSETAAAGAGPRDSRSARRTAAARSEKCVAWQATQSDVSWCTLATRSKHRRAAACWRARNRPRPGCNRPRCARPAADRCKAADRRRACAACTRDGSPART